MYRESKEISAPKVVEHPCLEGWRRTVDDAEARGRFTDMEFFAAMSWDQCAFGEAMERYGRSHSEDERLIDLGCSFAGAVGSQQFVLCKLILERIENRLAELAN